MRVLIHGYGLMSENRQDILAGHRMSGLTLYNSILFEGLQEYFDIAYLCGRLKPVHGFLDVRQLPSGSWIFEYDARFCKHLELDGTFVPELAKLWYHDRVDQPLNPIYRHLTHIYTEILDHFRPDIVNLHNLNASAAYIHATQAIEKPLPVAIATIHDTNPQQLDFIVRYQHYFTSFIAISKAVVDELQEAGIEPSRITYIPNGLPLNPFLSADSAEWAQIAEREGIPVDGSFQILIPARRVPEKGIEFAIKAFDNFFKKVNRPVRLILSGAGIASLEHESFLREFTNRLTCSSSVIFMGPIPYDKMPAVYAASEVSLLPSTIREGFGYANLEAMATGFPVVVTTAQGGCLDYIDHLENGILIPPEDQDAILRALHLIMNQPHLAFKLRKRARATAQKFTAKAMVDAYAKLFSRIL